MNTALASYTFAVGGQNLVDGVAGSASGAQPTRGAQASVCGGAGNYASGPRSSVSGGIENEAPGIAAAVLGGKQNFAEGFWSSVSGGESNKTTASYYSSTLGGKGLICETELCRIPQATDQRHSSWCLGDPTAEAGSPRRKPRPSYPLVL
jgi:hypothetical protein